LPAPVSVELIKHQEERHILWGLSLEDGPVLRAHQEQLRHHVVRQDDVGRIVADLLALFVRQILEEGELGVNQGVHGINDEGDGALQSGIPHHSVHDWYEETEGLSRPGARGDHEALALGGLFQGLYLVLPEAPLLSQEACEDPCSFGVDEVPLGKLFEGLGLAVCWGELNQGLGPEAP